MIGAVEAALAARGTGGSSSPSLRHSRPGEWSHENCALKNITGLGGLSSGSSFGSRTPITPAADLTEGALVIRHAMVIDGGTLR